MAEKEEGRKIKEGKAVMEKPTLGITLVGCLNIFFGLIAFFLAIIAMSMSIPLAIVLCVKALLGFISGVGLLYVKFWGWLLAVITCVISLVEFALHPTAFPLELVVLPYLIIKRRDFRRLKEWKERTGVGLDSKRRTKGDEKGK